MKSFIPASANSFSEWKPFFFCSEVFPPVETVTESSESQYLKRDHILSNVADVLISRNHFSFNFLDSGQMLEMQAVYFPTRIYFSGSW